MSSYQQSFQEFDMGDLNSLDFLSNTDDQMTEDDLYSDAFSFFPDAQVCVLTTHDPFLDDMSVSSPSVLASGSSVAGLYTCSSC